ncbi:hypothetical protein [Bradyrhizobium sp. CCGUVB23]|uniref:hypothetical protein n=1 Tax=Bradyrhizobium sp. CCGUVB23 TaxID=2949630 RepID=UPI0020B3C954|nr:hypothetical protein [Bradyrhizobium sp. CCGUVB23]MCP3459619.1 hypothetical protein [Bradyrhizobium sp. CCGUVB23]
MNNIAGWCFSVCDKNHGSAALIRLDEAKAALMIEEAPSLRRGTSQRQYAAKILLDDPEQSKFPIGAQGIAAIYTSGETGVSRIAQGLHSRPGVTGSIPSISDQFRRLKPRILFAAIAQVRFWPF